MAVWFRSIGVTSTSAAPRSCTTDSEMSTKSTAAPCSIWAAITLLPAYDVWIVRSGCAFSNASAISSIAPLVDEAASTTTTVLSAAIAPAGPASNPTTNAADQNVFT